MLRLTSLSAWIRTTNGNVYIADEMNNAIRVMNLNDPVFGVTNWS